MVMVDRQKLGAWIQPQHLEDDARTISEILYVAPSLFR
jgi:hypothetical protein